MFKRRGKCKRQYLSKIQVGFFELCGVVVLRGQKNFEKNQRERESNIFTEQHFYRANFLHEPDVRNCRDVAEVFKLVDKAILDRDSERLIAMVKALPQIAA